MHNKKLNCEENAVESSKKFQVSSRRKEKISNAISSFLILCVHRTIIFHYCTLDSPLSFPERIRISVVLVDAIYLL